MKFTLDMQAPGELPDQCWGNDKGELKKHIKLSGVIFLLPTLSNQERTLCDTTIFVAKIWNFKLQTSILFLYHLFFFSLSVDVLILC